MNDEEIEDIDFLGWPIPDEYLKEIGRISLLWATLESTLNLCIGKLAGFKLDDPAQFILLAHAFFPQRLNMLSTLCEELTPELHHLSNYKEAIAMLNKSSKDRNKFSHNVMVCNPETGNIEMSVGSARGTLKVAIEIITLADIRRAALTVNEAMLTLYNLVLQKEYQPSWMRRATNKQHPPKN